MHQNHLQKLDDFARNFIKKWLKIPKNGCNDSGIYHPYLLNMKTPSQLYKEGHASNYALIRYKGDNLVNHLVDAKIEREKNWKKKFSPIIYAKNIFENQGEFKSIQHMKKKIRKQVEIEETKRIEKKWRN